MCGIVGLHLRGSAHRENLGALLAGMLGGVRERGPDSAGVAIYGDPSLSAPGGATISLLTDSLASVAADRIARELGAADVTATAVGPVTVVTAPAAPAALRAAASAAIPTANVIGVGSDLAVFKVVGDPGDLAGTVGLVGRAGRRALAHTRMATESAVTAAHCHPFSVRSDLCLVHNGSFANHATVRRELAAHGVYCDTDNDSEVAARFLGHRMDSGDDLESALHRLVQTFDGFFTLAVTTGDAFAVVRDRVACKPAIIAETDDWVAMVSEYRALLGLPGLADARIYEPEPEEVYVWSS